MMQSLRSSVALALFGFLGLGAIPGANGQTLDGFQPAIDDLTWCIAFQPDGKVLVGGTFKKLDGKPCSYFGRLHPDGRLDESFKAIVDNWVNAIAIQPDGKIVIVGTFQYVDHQPRNRIARLNPDGTLDSLYNIGTGTEPIWALALQPDGKILVGGMFYYLGGKPRSKIARLNSDGSLDQGFNPGASGGVFCLTVQANGQILAGGEFTTLGGQPRRRIARINPDGTMDEGFKPAAEFREVNCFVEQPDGKLLVGGRFSSLAGQDCRGIGRLNPDGTLDTNFVAEIGGWVNTLCLQTDGRILFASSYGMYMIGRLLHDGRRDTSFDAISQSLWNGAYAASLQTDGKYIIAGEDRSLKRFLARWNNTGPATESFSFNGTNITWLRGGTGPEFYRTTFEACTNGTSWTELGIGSRIDGGWQIADLTLPDNATIVARGYAQGGLHNNSTWFVEKVLGPPLITLQPTNTTTIGGSNALFSVSGYADSFQWLKDGQPLADGGDISGATTAALSIGTAFGADSGSYQVVLSNANGAVTSSVATLTVLEPYITAHPASQVAHISQTVTLSGRGFGTEPLAYEWRRNGATIPGATESSLVLTIDWGDIGDYELVVSNAYGRAISSKATITVEAAPDDSFTNAVHGQVYGLALQSDGAILCGTTGDTNLIRMTPNGASDPDFKPSTNGKIVCVAVQPDGKILVGGEFTMLCDQVRNYVGRINPDGTLDQEFDPGAGGIVLALKVRPDGKILVAGEFSVMGDQPQSGIALLNQNGQLETGFRASLTGGKINSVALQADGKVLMGGRFSGLDPEGERFLARLNDDGSVDSSFNVPCDNDVNCLLVQPDQRILVGGNFAMIGGEVRYYLARLNPDGTLDSTFPADANDNVISMALQANGKLLVGSNFRGLGGVYHDYLGRLNSDGTVDLNFRPEASGPVYSLALQSDGKFLAGGAVNGLVRFSNDEPAEEQLCRSGSAITWLRSGSCPEFWRTTFEISTNRVDWVELGCGARVTNGWELVNAPPSPGSWIRARGYVASGVWTGSAWFEEAVLSPVVRIPPTILANDADFGFRSDRFGFNLTAAPGETVVIEYSTDLVEWTPLSTNSVSTGSLYFNDLPGDASHRFYRLRSEP